MTRLTGTVLLTAVLLGLVLADAAGSGLGSAWGAQPAARTGEDDLNFAELIRPAPKSAKFLDENYYIWCGSLIRTDDGKYHLFYSRWPRKLGHFAWVTHSEVAHAAGDSPTGPFRFVDVALPERGKPYWDGSSTHNPTIQHFAGKYYLYYTGNLGDGKAMKTINWTHRGSQRVGVAVADHPNGPWKRFDKPLVDVSEDPEAPDALCTTNPSVTRRPDGGFLLVYKAVAKKRPAPAFGPVVHLTATADSPTGPFRKQMRPTFTAVGSDFPAEDPYVWHQADRGRYYAILKDMRGSFTDAGRSLVLFTSVDGFDWNLAKHPLVSKLEIPWVGGTRQPVRHLERPQLYFENGRPAVLLCAADEDGARSHSFNVQIPLK